MIPVSVVIPAVPERRAFRESVVIPLLRHEGVAEIRVVERGLSAPVQRNLGFEQSSQPFVFFCDDDVMIWPGALRRLYDVLRREEHLQVAYGDYVFVDHPRRGTGLHDANPRKNPALIEANSISTMSLVRRTALMALPEPPFDEALPRFQDWDLWLRVREAFSVTVFGYEPGDPVFTAFYGIGGSRPISERAGFEEGMARVRKKHGLG